MRFPPRCYVFALVWSIVAVGGLKSANSQVSPSEKYAMPPPQDCAAIDKVVEQLRLARSRTTHDAAGYDRYLDTVERFRAACLGALDFDSLPGGSADALVHEAPNVSISIPQYRSAS